MAVLAIASCLLLPLLAARVVRGAMERSGAMDRAAYASGTSPWSWRFRDANDLVAGKVFGDAAIKSSEQGLIVAPTRSGRGELGFPLTRQADLSRLNLLRLDASAPAGQFSIVVRPTLSAPLVRADLTGLAAPIRLDQLTWRDATGATVAAPRRAAMLRLSFMLPTDATLVLRGASLARASGPLPEAGTPIPGGLTAEGLLHWRDQQRAIDPLATFGSVPTPSAEPKWLRLTPVAIYFVLLVANGIRTRRQRAGSRFDDLAHAALAAGPLWLIAGLGLAPRPDASAVAMFAGGVAYAAYLTWIRAVPRWHWKGNWRMAGWPLLAIPVALGVAAVAGHAPIWPPLGRALLYIGWAFFQQWLMLAVVAGLLARALPRPAAVLLTALAFALLHTPNGLLMQLCFVAELGWAWWYLHHRSLLPVAVAHAAAAVIMQACMAGGVLRSLEVSARFLS
jgi:hypothetical protein